MSLSPFPHFLLASTSSIRKKILDDAKLSYEAHKPLLPEERADPKDNPYAYVLRCANSKAKEISKIHPNQIVVGCDQIVYFEGNILNKVLTAQEGIDRLIDFRGKTHLLVNGMSIFYQEKEIHSTTEETKIKVRSLSNDYIINYFNEEMPLSSVACYYLEGQGIKLIESLTGNYHSALGFPLLQFLTFLQNFKGT